MWEYVNNNLSLQLKTTKNIHQNYHLLNSNKYDIGNTKSMAERLSVRLRTKWLWVRILVLSLNNERF